ncbi:MAG: hypothetical protein ACRDY0_02665 [Acidimicrobiales bacterium]
MTAKLTKTDIYAPKKEPRGGFDWMIQWKLDHPSPAGGWIVQKVEVAHNVTKPPGRLRKFVRGSRQVPVRSGFEAFVPYWEAWKVNAGKDVTNYAQGGDTNDDQFASPPFAEGTKGILTETGAPQFHEGLALPGSFKENGVQPAGILMATRSDPGALAGGTGTIPHSLTATWDSQAGDGQTTIATT